MTIDPPLPTIGLVLAVSLLALLFAGFVFSRAAKRGVSTVIALVFCTALGAMLLSGLSTQQDAKARAEAKSASLREQALQIAMHAARTAPTPPPAPPAGNFEEFLHEAYGSASKTPTIEAEVATDEELAAVASAQPKIQLEAVSVPVEDVDVKVSEANATDDTADVKRDRPDWINAHLGDNQKLIVSGPFTTRDSCESDTNKQLIDWIWSLQEDLWPSSAGPYPELPIDLVQIRSQYEELRDTSVGEMHLLYTLAEVTPEIEAQIAKSLAEAAAQVAKRRGVRAVSFAGAGVLSLVALTHVVLRSGGRKAASKPIH
jgi:hypothetical protein